MVHIEGIIDDRAWNSGNIGIADSPGQMNATVSRLLSSPRVFISRYIQIPRQSCRHPRPAFARIHNWPRESTTKQPRPPLRLAGLRASPEWPKWRARQNRDFERY